MTQIVLVPGDRRFDVRIGGQRAILEHQAGLAELPKRVGIVRDHQDTRVVKAVPEPGRALSPECVPQPQSMHCYMTIKGY